MKIGILTADVDHLQKQNAGLQAKLEKASELAEANKELSKTNSDLARQLDDLLGLFYEATDDAKAAHVDLKSLGVKLATNDAAAATRNDNALLEKIKRLEEKKKSLEAALAEWAELAKVCQSITDPCLQALTIDSAHTRNIRKCCPSADRLYNTVNKLLKKRQRPTISNFSL